MERKLTSKTTMGEVRDSILAEGTGAEGTIWIWRDCEIQFELYEYSEEGDEGGVVISLFPSKGGKSLWSGSTNYSRKDRALDTMRAARENAELQKSEEKR
jgi:hypothetical protein